jgi:hypothetical protein
MADRVLVSVIIPTYNRATDVIKCVKSVLNSTLKNIEVIVVDNASTDNTIEKLKIFSSDSRFKLIKSLVNLGAGGGRNRGAPRACGKYLLFVDSDNIIDSKMVEYLVDFFDNRPDCGMVGPLMLIESNRKIIWTYFADINMYTSQAKYKGTGEKNIGQFPEVIPVGHLPNCFMVKNREFKKVGGFEEKYLIIYEEADLAEKIKRLRKKIYLFSKAITYHAVDLPKPEDKKNYGFRSPERAFLLARNRVYFMKRNANWLQKIAFFVVFNPIICCYYQLNLIRTGQSNKARAYLRGYFTGIFT